MTGAAVTGGAGPRRVAGLLAATLLAWLLAGCGTAAAQVPRCGAVERLGLIAQSVPSASYVPCLDGLPQGWRTGEFSVASGHTSFTLVSDRAAGHPVTVQLRAACSVADATPTTARTPGGRTYLRLSSIEPRYAGTMFDVFPGGCVTYRFDFERGSHIALMADLASMVAFVSRPQLTLDLRAELGVDLDGTGTR